MTEPANDSPQNAQGDPWEPGVQHNPHVPTPNDPGTVLPPDEDSGAAKEGNLGTVTDDEFHAARSDLPAGVDTDGRDVDLHEGVVDDR
jgi:hypothetical protein